MTQRERLVLVVRGAPGVGKSSAVRLLRREMTDGATIEVDDLRRMLAGVKWKDSGQHRMALEHASMLARSFLDREVGPVVVVDTFNRGLLGGFVESLGAPTRVVTLWAEEAILRARVEGRPTNEFRDVEACVRINAEVPRTPHDSEAFVDTSSMTVADVTAVMLRALRAER